VGQAATIATTNVLVVTEAITATSNSAMNSDSDGNSKTMIFEYFTIDQEMSKAIYQEAVEVSSNKLAIAGGITRQQQSTGANRNSNSNEVQQHHGKQAVATIVKLKML